jgi:hypothetical protein
MMTSLRSKWAVGKARGGRIPHQFWSSGDLPSFRDRAKTGAGRNRRATRPPAHFQRNPLGRGQLAVFPRCSLGPSSTIYMSAAKAPNSWRKMVLYGRFVTASPARTALKNSQLTYGDVTIICETVH